MSWRESYSLRRKYRDLSDDELLSVLLLASDKARTIPGLNFELHPAEKALANEYLLINSKLEAYCRGEMDPKQVVEAIHELLEWPCPEPPL
jgi:hypothetical protein